MHIEEDNQDVPPRSSTKNPRHRSDIQDKTIYQA